MLLQKAISKILDRLESFMVRWYFDQFPLSIMPFEVSGVMAVGGAALLLTDIDYTFRILGLALFLGGVGMFGLHCVLLARAREKSE